MPRRRIRSFLVATLYLAWSAALAGKRYGNGRVDAICGKIRGLLRSRAVGDGVALTLLQTGEGFLLTFVNAGLHDKIASISASENRKGIRTYQNVENVEHLENLSLSRYKKRQPKCVKHIRV